MKQGGGFRWRLRVYYEDTDLGGIVYHANYLRYMERARTEWLRALGCEQDRLKTEHSAVFVVVSANLQFRAPARFNDLLEVDVRMLERGRVSVTVEQNVYREVSDAREPSGEAPLEHVCLGEFRIACVDASSLHPRAIPDFLYAELQA